MNVPLEKVCEYLREWGDLTVGELRSLTAERMGDRITSYKKHSRGELLALLMDDQSNWENGAARCTR